ncbi:zona pellucida-binding protein 2 [Anolis carolinensis]|uniref:Zona pellucida binding protein 2 n=1 Tax=Anolis carolinensis TaxID=28377 RepID=G1KBQ8_ANOCA
MQGCSSWLSFLLLVAPQFLLVLGIKMNIHKKIKEENGLEKIPHSIKLIKKNYIYGNPNHKVNVYVKVHRNSPFLVCMDISLSQNEVIDPTYLWIGPNGQILKGKSYVNLTSTGKLMVLGFRERMSGSYTCTLSYRVFRNDLRAEQERFKTYKFMVYAYREPDYTYRMSVHFETKACNLLANDEFFEELKKILNNLISYLTCHIADPSYKCHSVKRPKHGIGTELFIVFQVNPFARGWDVICHQLPADCEDVTNSHIRQARWLIEEFFRRQESFLKHNYKNIPPIHYIDHSFQVTRLDSCRPGFGKNDITHSDCANCCVACDPGTYSPNNEVLCEKCTGLRIKHYGAKTC